MQIDSDQIAAALKRFDIGNRQIDGPGAGIDQLARRVQFAQMQPVQSVALHIGFKRLALLLADLRQPQHGLEAGILRQDLVREGGEFPAVDVMGR